MKWICLTLVFLSVVFLKAQEEVSYISPDETKVNSSFKEKLFTGGNFGFNVSNGLMYLEVAPILGYKVNEKISAGISAKYLYFGAINNNVPARSYKYYGGGVFSRYKITTSIFAAADYELLNVENLNPNSLSYGDRTFSNVFLLGGGYSNSIANRINMQISLHYDIIDDPNSPYRYNYIFGPNGIPIIYRIGFSIGF